MKLNAFDKKPIQYFGVFYDVDLEIWDCTECAYIDGKHSPDCELEKNLVEIVQ